MANLLKQLVFYCELSLSSAQVQAHSRGRHRVSNETKTDCTCSLSLKIDQFRVRAKQSPNRIVLQDPDFPYFNHLDFIFSDRVKASIMFGGHLSLFQQIFMMLVVATLLAIFCDSTIDVGNEEEFEVSRTTRV